MRFLRVWWRLKGENLTLERLLLRLARTEENEEQDALALLDEEQCTGEIPDEWLSAFTSAPSAPGNCHGFLQVKYREVKEKKRSFSKKNDVFP